MIAKDFRNLLSTWVKDPNLRNNILVIASECIAREENFLKYIQSTYSNSAVLTLACPEKERDTYHGKIAAIIKCACPREIHVITREGSPHCFLLHSAVNEAVFLTGSTIQHKHFVYFNGRVIEIDADAVRVARYLHIVNELIRKVPDIVKILEGVSLEKRLTK